MRPLRIRDVCTLQLLVLLLALSLPADAQELPVPELLQSCKFGETVDLLKQQGLLKLDTKQAWTFKAGRLSSDPGQFAHLYIPYRLPDRYVIKAKLKRESGNRSFGFGFTMGDGQSTVILDGWKKRFSGLDRLDGENAAFLKNPTRIERTLFKDGVESEI